MSEAMTNPEIEDVLASIRRLVAQDRRPRPERLILTEEFRVKQANIPAPPLVAQAPEGPPLVEIVAQVVRAVQLAPGTREPAAEAAAPPEPAAGAAAEAPVVGRESLESALSALEAQLPPPAGTEAPDLSDSAPDNGRDSAAKGAPERPPAATGEIMGEDVAFIDEDDLERIVARIVRDELRGQLGERITLMVRKLVRAEIARALDERNLLG